MTEESKASRQEEFKARMNELVSIDLDLPPVKRWQLEAVFFPEMGVAFAKEFGTKEDVKFYKELAKKGM